MGDTWPYAPPHIYPKYQVFDWIETLTGPHPDANIFTAIAEAESGFDASVVFDNPPTEDLSVGIWQVNYFGDLYPGRVAQFGTPKQLVLGGIGAQAYAAVEIWKEQGYGAWGTYNSGAYLQYLGTPQQPPAGVAPGQKTQSLEPPIGQGIDAWDGQVRQAAVLTQTNANTALTYSRGIDAI